MIRANKDTLKLNTYWIDGHHHRFKWPFPIVYKVLEIIKITDSNWTSIYKIEFGDGSIDEITFFNMMDDIQITEEEYKQFSLKVKLRNIK
jgi:hypothetical protein